MTRPEYEERFNRRLNSHKKMMIAATIPVFALGLVPLYRRRRYGEHLIFSIHLFAALLFFMVVVMQLVFVVLGTVAQGLVLVVPELIGSVNRVLQSEASVVLLIYGPMLMYLQRALRRVYGGGQLATGAYAFILAVWHLFMIIFVFRLGLFFTTFLSLEWFG